MHRRNCVWFILLAGVWLTPARLSCDSYYWTPPSANVDTGDYAAIVAYDAQGGAQVEGHSVSDGRILWRTCLSSAILARNVCVADGLVHVATLNKGVCVLDCQTGTMRGCLQPCGPAHGSSPLMACLRNRVFIAYYGSSRLMACSKGDLRPVWRRVVAGSAIHQLAASGDEVTLLIRRLSGTGGLAASGPPG